MEELYDQVDDIFAPERKKLMDIQEYELNQLIDAAQVVFKTREGRRLLWWIMSRGNIFASTYNGRALDQAHADGQRLIAAEMFNLALKADQNILVKLIDDKLMVGEE